MPNYSFLETIGYFSEKLNTSPPQEDLDSEEVELVVDNLHLILAKGKLEGSMHIHIVLGLLLQPIREERLKELATSNFLGVDTGGCKLALDEMGVSLCLHSYVTCGANPQENWEWLHRILCAAREWNKILSQWEEFVPLATTVEEAKDESSKGGGMG